MELFFSWKSRLGCNASNCTKENLNLTGDPRLCLTTTEISVVANAITMLIGLVIIAGMFALYLIGIWMVSLNAQVLNARAFCYINCPLCL